MAQAKPLMGTPLNRAHPLSQGLVGCWPMNEGSGTVIYDSSRSNKGTFGGDTLPTWVNGLYGPEVSIPASGNKTYVAISAISGLARPLSYMVVFRPLTSPATNSYLIDLGSNTAITYRVNGDVKLYDGTFFDTTITPTLGAECTIIVTDTAAGSAIAYINGTPYAGPIGNGGAIGAITIGQYGGLVQSGNNAAAAISAVNIWNRVLSAQEVSYLTAFPFAMFDTDTTYPFDPSTTNTLITAGSLPIRRF